MLRIIGLGIVAIFVIVGLWIASTVMYGVGQVSQVGRNTFNADSMTYNYEWFKRQYNDFLAIGKKLEVATAARKDFAANAGPRENWSFEDKQEAGRLASIEQGLASQREDIRSKYNAQSQMANRSIFRTSDLPEQL